MLIIVTYAEVTHIITYGKEIPNKYFSECVKERCFVSSCKNPCGRDSWQSNMGRPAMNNRNSCRPMPPGNCGYRDMEKMMKNDGCGYKKNKYLEDMPLAMAYVPFQVWREIYQPDEALQVGTIFKELNLPFTGRRRCK